MATDKAEGSGALMSLKNKMQSVREELDRYRELYESTRQELETEKGKRTQVPRSFLCPLLSRPRFCWNCETGPGYLIPTE